MPGLTKHGVVVFTAAYNMFLRVYSYYLLLFLVSMLIHSIEALIVTYVGHPVIY